MTKTELQTAIAEATQTNKRTAGVFLDTLSALAYKESKKNGEFVLPGFGKLVKQKRKARTGFNPKTQQKIKIPAKTVVKFRVAKAGKGWDSRREEVGVLSGQFLSTFELTGIDFSKLAGISRSAEGAPLHRVSRM